MNLLVSGFFYSGSSAVYDFLKSYSSIGYITTGEFDEFKASQMIGDYLSNRIGGDYPNSAIQRYLNCNRNFNIYKYIDLKFDWMTDSKLTEKDINRFKLLTELDYRLSKVECIDKRMVLAKEYLSNVHYIYAKEKKYLMIDQAVPFGIYEGIWQEFFSPFKLIVVKRNILDQIADIIKHKQLFMHGHHLPFNIKEQYGDGKLGHISNHIHNIYYQYNYIKNKESEKPDQVLLVSFEDFIKDHFNIKSKILGFLSISKNDYQEENSFNIFRSKENIGFHTRYLSNKEIDFIKSITSRLGFQLS